MQLKQFHCRRWRGYIFWQPDGMQERFERGTVAFASAGLEGGQEQWSMKQGRCTPGYATSWDGLVLLGKA